MFFLDQRWSANKLLSNISIQYISVFIRCWKMKKTKEKNSEDRNNIKYSVFVTLPWGNKFYISYGLFSKSWISIEIM